MNDNVINFNKARKKADLNKKEKQATENRVKFGRTKAEKKAEKNKKDKLTKHIDGHELDE